ncbi:hypothetical protein JW905_18820, partial [bacterium]|nr:hypothetical protein [candidate division CSSED10-310 bacterium]
RGILRSTGGISYPRGMLADTINLELVTPGELHFELAGLGAPVWGLSCAVEAPVFLTLEGGHAGRAGYQAGPMAATDAGIRCPDPEPQPAGDGWLRRVQAARLDGMTLLILHPERTVESRSVVMDDSTREQLEALGYLN